MTDRPIGDPAPTRPFADALRAAVRDAEITLEQVAEHLRRCGAPVSLATLSYWRSGRSQPERPASLVALGHLERLLGLREGELRRLLERPKPRGRRARPAPEPVSAGAPWTDPEEFRRLVGGMDMSRDADLTRLSAHDRVEVGPDRRKHRQRTRQVLRAEADGVDRLVVVTWADAPDSPLPTITGVRNCALGRVNVDQRSGQIAAELLFDRPLARRETVVVEHEVDIPPPRPEAFSHQRMSRLPVREYLVEVVFDPAALPLHCVQFSQIGGDERVRALTLDSAHTAHALGMDLDPGRYGIRWSWPPP